MSRTGKIFFALCCLLIAGGAAYYVYREFWSADAQSSQAAPTGRRGAPGSGPTPVVAAPATIGAVDVVMNGLGTVTPLRTVTVRSRVDGELMRVLFDEGQVVKEGQLLAEIDPRSFQVMLAQAEGQLARDRALLENARLDLARYQALFAQDSIAKQQVDTQVSLVRQYEGAVQVDRSQIDSAKLQLDYARIKSELQVDDERLLDVLRDPAAATAQPDSLLFTLTQWDKTSLDDVLTQRSCSSPTRASPPR
jgi:multidrug efflux system membrane fusion protein